MSTLELDRVEMRPQQPQELWCGACGYGVVVHGQPPACPMCRGSSWRERPGIPRPS
ncbi:MAG TPA: hypothetical protein VF186_10115 [Gaiellaceae bacterium]|jgi:rubrerythrin